MNTRESSLTADADPPAISVVIASDYAGGEQKSWDDLRRASRGWARQDYDGTAEYLYVESSAYAGDVPGDLVEVLPGLRVCHVASDTSYELKNFGVEQARAPIVAIVDADCEPHPSWLSRLVNDFRAHPDVVAVSGVTRYHGTGRLRRLLGLMGRSYIDPGGPGPTRFVSGCAAGFRRDAYLANPLPVGHGAFASRLQSEAMRRAGARFYFDPQMATTHDFEGWSMERDIRRNTGYCTVATRLLDPRLPHAWLIRIGRAAIPAIVVAKYIACIGDCLRCARHFGVRRYEVPAAWLLAVATHLMEVPGMLAAYRGQPIVETQYR